MQLKSWPHEVLKAWLTMACGRSPSCPEFQIHQYTVGGFGGHTGFGLSFLINGGELEYFHHGAHDQAHFQQSQISSRTETRSMPESKVQNIFRL